MVSTLDLVQIYQSHLAASIVHQFWKENSYVSVSQPFLIQSTLPLFKYNFTAPENRRQVHTLASPLELFAAPPLRTTELGDR